MVFDMEINELWKENQVGKIVTMMHHFGRIFPRRNMNVALLIFGLFGWTLVI